MTTMMLDLRDVEPVNEFGFDPIEPGMYDAKINEAEFKFAKSGDNSPMVVVEWQILGGPYEGRKVRYHNVVFNPKTQRIVKGVLLALGLKIPNKQVTAEGLAKAFARDARGKIARITVADGKPNSDGKVFPEVKAIYPANIPGAAVPGASDSSGEDLPEL